MIHLKNIKEYDRDDFPGIFFFRSECGSDWYETRSRFKKETWKVAYFDDGTIYCVHKDPEQIRPLENSNILEMKEIPETLTPDTVYNFKWDGKKFIENKHIQVEIQQDHLLLISAQIEALKDKIEFGTSTQEDEARLLELRKQRSELV